MLHNCLYIDKVPLLDKTTNEKDAQHGDVDDINAVSSWRYKISGVVLSLMSGIFWCALHHSVL